ncbi:MAG TPA: hypothetical protein PKL83_05465, partial [bacterium]|nr:hypothetical protein [bacterium]
MSRSVFLLIIPLALLVILGLTGWWFLKPASLSNQEHVTPSDTLTNIPVTTAPAVDIDKTPTPLPSGFARAELPEATIDYPDTWGMQMSAQGTRLVLTSPDSVINVYSFPLAQAQSLAGWIRETQQAYFDSFPFLDEEPFSLQGYQTYIVQYCETALSYTAYLDGQDALLMIWSSGTEADFRTLLAHVYPAGASADPTVLPEQFSIYDEPACHPSPEPGPEPDPATICDYSDIANNSCCSQYTEREVPYWSCSTNFTGDYGN